MPLALLVSILCAGQAAPSASALAADKPGSRSPTTLFLLGKPDGTALEFGAAKTGWQSYRTQFPKPVVFTVGQDPVAAWPYIHPSTHDSWAGGGAHTFTVRFGAGALPAEPLYLTLGLASAHPTPSLLTVSVNGTAVASRRAPAGQGNGDPDLGVGQTALVFAVPPGTVRSGTNTLVLTLADGSWLIYDYVRLGTDPKPAELTTRDDSLLARFRAGPMTNVTDLVFAVRKIVPEHWYANFGYYASDGGQSYFGNANKLYRDGGRLCRLNLATGQVTTLLDDPRGGVRDPQVHYDGRKVLFSYRKGGTEHYHLYEVNADGTGLRQLTDGAYDDIEPSYLPDGGIVFASSRCHRWVNCWLSQVAVLYRCDADGRDVHPLSSNNEHDNTPWLLHDGRILYTRWEYVDRSQVDYHHLWVVNPDGTSQMVLYGNLHPSTVMIDAKPVPGSDQIVANFSPGHGQTEHEGAVALVDPRAGPDDRQRTRRISRTHDFRDPWAFSEEAFLAARQHSLVLLDDTGATQDIFRLSQADIKAGFHVHEPRPLTPRPRENVLAARTRRSEPTGRLLLANIYEGRNMAGVKPGEVKHLLVLETLPKPINFTGGMEPLSYGGTFTLERILGTVPVEADGSAYLEVPALRSVFFVALDEQDLSVKRMQSFVTVQPGEVTSCVGCHEPRTQTPAYSLALNSARAARRPPSRIQPLREVPDVLDYPRDVQPILDRHCVRCHDYGATNHGGVFLAGDRGPMLSLSYFALFARNQVADGRNRARSNYAPRTIGSSASPLLQKLEAGHYGVSVTPLEKKTVRLWIDTGAPFPGTYAALGCGMIGGYAQNSLDRSDLQWPATKAGVEVLKRRCAECHTGRTALPLSASDEHVQPPWVDMTPDDPRRRYSRHLLYNLSRPERSLLLLAPLSRGAGGLGVCRKAAPTPTPSATPNAIFASTADPDYQTVLAAITAAKAKLDEIKRFDMPDFQPRIEWVREMKKYGVLTADAAPVGRLDPYAIERKYWQSLWHVPSQ